MKLYALVLALSFASDANANRIRGTTNSSHTTHNGQRQQDNSNSQYQSQEEELDVATQCLSYEHEDAEEEDDDITNMNIALCEDYFSLQCNAAFTNDCSTLLSLYVSSDGREPSWPNVSSRKQLRDSKSKISEVAHECNIYTGKKRGHCIAFMGIQRGECCNNKYSKVCTKIRTKLFESSEDEDVVCSSGESRISEWRLTRGDSNPYVPWSPM